MPAFEFGPPDIDDDEERKYCPYMVTVDSLALALDLPMGVGKSFAFREWIKKNEIKSVLMVSIRISLTVKWAEEMDSVGIAFADYRDEGAFDSPRLICQLDSLHHIKRNYDIIFFDEIQCCII